MPINIFCLWRFLLWLLLVILFILLMMFAAILLLLMIRKTQSIWCVFWCIVIVRTGRSGMKLSLCLPVNSIIRRCRLAISLTRFFMIVTSVSQAYSDFSLFSLALFPLLCYLAGG